MESENLLPTGSASMSGLASTGSAKLVNFDEVIPDDYHPKHIQKHFLGPQHPFRMVIAGPSGAGKTNILLNIIMKMTHWDHLYLYAKKLDEPKYKWLIDQLKELQKNLKMRSAKEFPLARLPNDKSDSILTSSSKIEDVIDPDYLDEKKQNLIIVDDMITESARSHKTIEDLYIRGRKNNASIIYLTQSYHDTPKLIRKQANYIIFVGIENKRELTELQKEHANRITKDQFMAAYRAILNDGQDGDFMLIDKKTKKLPLHIRKNFDGLLDVSSLKE